MLRFVIDSYKICIGFKKLFILFLNCFDIFLHYGLHYYCFVGEVSEFSAYFQRLLPGSNPRNPWFDELWQQEEMNADVESDVMGRSSTVGYRSLQSTTNTIQAIVAVAAGIATLRNNLCRVIVNLPAGAIFRPTSSGSIFRKQSSGAMCFLGKR